MLDEQLEKTKKRGKGKAKSVLSLGPYMHSELTFQ